MKHKVKHKSNKTNKGAKVDDPTVLRINQTARLAAQKARSVVGTGKHSQDSDSSGEPPILRQAAQANLSKNVQERNAQKKDVVNKIYAGKSQKEVEQLNNFFKMQVANDASLAQRGQQTKAKQNFDSMLKRQAAASVQAKADREDNDWARSTLMKKPSLSTKKPSKPPVATGGYSRGNSNGYDEVYKPKPVVYPTPKTYRPGVNTPRAI